MRKLIKVGVIGTGFGQQVHVPAFRADDRCQVVGVCGSTQERAQKVASRLEIPRAFADWQTIVKDPEVDVVSIAVPPVLQGPIVQAAARAGKHVFCEKPVAMSAIQAEEMLKATETFGIVHAVDFLFPDIGPWKKAKGVLETKPLGRIRNVALSWRVETFAHRAGLHSWKTRVEDGGGTLNNLVSHSFYYLEWLLGPIRRLCARLSPRPPATDSSVDAWLEFDAGFPATLSVAADAFLGSGHRLEIYGEQGALLLENRSTDHAAGFGLQVGTRESGALSPIARNAEDAPGGDGRLAAVTVIVKRFLDAVITGNPVIPNLYNGLRVQVLLDAVRRAAERETWQTV